SQLDHGQAIARAPAGAARHAQDVDHAAVPLARRRTRERRHRWIDAVRWKCGVDLADVADEEALEPAFALQPVGLVRRVSGRRPPELENAFDQSAELGPVL